MRLTDAAFEGAVERYGDTVFRLAYSYLKNRADAEDVMQETLLKLVWSESPSRSPEHEPVLGRPGGGEREQEAAPLSVAQADRASGGGRGAGVRHAAAE